MRYALLCFLLLFSAAAAQQAPPTSQVQQKSVVEAPNPVALKPKWWLFFKETSDEQLKTRVSLFSFQLDSLIESTPKESQERLAPLAQKVYSNLNAFFVAHTQPVTKKPPIIPSIQAYSLSELVALSRELRNNELLLQNDQEDFSDRQKQMDSAETSLRKLWKRYGDIAEKSEEKLTLGLQIINLRISLEIAKIKQANLKQVIAIDKESVKQGRIELKSALEKVEITDQEIQGIEQGLENAKRLWSEEKEDLNEQEANSLTQFDFSQQGDLAKLRNQILAQKLTFVSIEEAIAYNTLTLHSAQLALVKYLQEPTPSALEELEKETKRWRRDHSQLKQNISEWELSIKRDIQRAEEWLSLNLKNTNMDSREVARLQEEILNLAERSLVLLIKLQNEAQDTNFVLEILTKNITQESTSFTSYLTAAQEKISELYSSLEEILAQPLFTFGETVVGIGDIVTFLVIVLLSFWFATLVEIAIGRVALKGRALRHSMVYRIKRLFKYLIISIGVIIALGSLGFNLSSFVLIASALGVGLGFGLQSLFNNFVSGLIILFESQLKVGDFVELESGVRGEVKEVNARSTHIKTNDGIDIIVPNSEFTQGRVINWTWKEPYRRMRIEFGVARDSDKALVEKVVAKAVKEVPLTLKKSWAPEPRVYITELGPHSINFTCAVWVDSTATKRYLYARSAYLWAIHEALQENGIKIPYPQLDLHLPD